MTTPYKVNANTDGISISIDCPTRDDASEVAIKMLQAINNEKTLLLLPEPAHPSDAAAKKKRYRKGRTRDFNRILEKELVPGSGEFVAIEGVEPTKVVHIDTSLKQIYRRVCYKLACKVTPPISSLEQAVFDLYKMHCAGTCKMRMRFENDAGDAVGKVIVR